MRWILRLRALALAVGCLLLASGVGAETVHKIGLSVWSGYPESVAGFKAALQAAGLREGIEVHYREGKSDGDPELQRNIVKAFRSDKVDLVYSLTTPGTILVKEGMPDTTPVVFSIVTYPADSGLIESFEYSGNNLVGTSNYVPTQHYVSLLKDLLPEVKKVAIFHRKGEPNSKIQAANMIRMFRRAKIKAVSVEASSLSELFTLASQVEAQAFVTTTDTLMQDGGEEVLQKVADTRGVPILSSNKKGIEQGSTFGPVADFFVLGRMAGEKAVDILLNGTRPSQLQSETQNPPLILANRRSFERLQLELPATLEHRVLWVGE